MATLIPLSSYRQILLRAWPFAAAGVAIGVVCGTGLLAAAGRTYEATTSVLVAAAPVLITDSPGDRTRLFTVDTEAQRVRSAPVAEAMRAAGGDDLLDPAVTVSALPNTTALRITVHSRSSRSAVRGADATAQAYLKARGEALRERRQAHLNPIRASIASLNNELQQLGPEQDTAGFAARTALLQRRVRGQQLEFATEATPVYPGSVIHRASAVRTGRRNVLLPPLGGAVLGATAGLLFSQGRRTRVRTLTDLSALVPRQTTGDGRDDTYLLALREACGTGPRTLVVLSASDRSASALPISDALQRLSPPVQLIDAASLPTADDAALLGALARSRTQASTSVVDAGGLSGPERALVCSAGDGVVLVVPPGCPADQAEEAANFVGRAGGNLVGMVLLGTSAGRNQR